MTTTQIANGLELLVFRLANNQEIQTPPSGLEPHEWAYIKGVASAAIMRTRDALLDAGSPLKPAPSLDPGTVGWSEKREKSE